jgi:hypothetical protein
MQQDVDKKKQRGFLHQITFVLIVYGYYVAAALLLWAGLVKIFMPELRDILEIFFETSAIGAEQTVFFSIWFPVFEIVVAVVAILGIRASVMARGMGVIYLGFALLTMYVAKGHVMLPLECGGFKEASTVPVYLLLLRDLAIAILLFFYSAAYEKYTLYSRLRGLRR